jgi:hypothetical protein
MSGERTGTGCPLVETGTGSAMDAREHKPRPAEAPTGLPDDDAPPTAG